MARRSANDGAGAGRRETYLWTQGQNNLSSHISLEMLSFADPVASPANNPPRSIDEGTHVS